MNKVSKGLLGKLSHHWVHWPGVPLTNSLLKSDANPGPRRPGILFPLVMWCLP